MQCHRQCWCLSSEGCRKAGGAFFSELNAREMLVQSILRELVLCNKNRTEETLRRKYKAPKGYSIMREGSENDWVGTEAREIQMRNKVLHVQSEKD